jgi:hypothetical protein
MTLTFEGSATWLAECLGEKRRFRAWDIANAQQEAEQWFREILENIIGALIRSIST